MDKRFCLDYPSLVLFPCAEMPGSKAVCVQSSLTLKMLLIHPREEVFKCQIKKDDRS